jgi:N-acetyl-gamma-glutamyl-phosphate reductase
MYYPETRIVPLDFTVMYERFTDRARKVLALANDEALRLDHEYLDTFHILLGLIKEGSGVGASVLKKMNVDFDKARIEVEKLVKRGGKKTDKLPQTPRAKMVIQYAIEESSNLNHNYVGTEHILLGLVREHDGVAAQVLRELGLKLEQIREEILNTLKQGMQTKTSTATRSRPVFHVGILGVSGYGGGEALRLCAVHPSFQVDYVAGETSAGQKLRERFPGITPNLADLSIQKFDPATLPDLDLLFASLPTGESKAALAAVSPKTKIVDIGGDHRYANGWTYGLADIWPDKIRTANRVANPGCYPSAALTAIAPLLAAGLIDLSHPIIIDAKSGVSGAGRGGGDSKFSYAEINEDLTAYGLLKHAHLPEMTQTVRDLSGGKDARLVFTPHLIPMTRGILATCYLTGSATSQQCQDAARKFYADRPFVRVVDQPPHTKWATGSNLVFLHYAANDGGPIIALAAIDNLGKGAAGQAVQNANLMLGLPETAGLEGSPLWP